MELTYAEGEKHSSWVTLMSHVRMVEVPVKVNMSWALSPASACISRYTEIFYIYSTLHYIESWVCCRCSGLSVRFWSKFGVYHSWVTSAKFLGCWAPFPLFSFTQLLILWSQFRQPSLSLTSFVHVPQSSGGLIEWCCMLYVAL